MHIYNIFAWQPLLRPPLPNDEPPSLPSTPLKALACRNSVASLAVLVTANQPTEHARLVFSDLIGPGGPIQGSVFTVRQAKPVPTPEKGEFCDPLYEVDDFSIQRSAALFAGIRIPKGIPAGIYRGTVSLMVEDNEAARCDIEVEIADVDLPDVHDWSFFLNVWMNPGAVAHRYGVEMWSDEHFRLLKPYIRDLAEHGQKTAVVPICYQPWGTQTPVPFPNAVIWKKRGNKYEFDFSTFDRYVELHEECGIDRAIHCYSIAPAPGDSDKCKIVYIDCETGEDHSIDTAIGDAEYVKAWSAFFTAFRDHLSAKCWLQKTYIAFDEKPAEIMKKLVAVINDIAPDFKTALAANSRSDVFTRLDDLSLYIFYDENGVTETAPVERSAMGVAEMLDPHNACAMKTITTFYVCCGPEFPNTFVFSPLVESRMLPFLGAQGGFDGFLRWSYNDWPEDPYNQPHWGQWPTGDLFLVYPGEDGPVSSLRWEQLREGIQDYELAMIAATNMKTSEDIVDYEQAISLACRNVDGRVKSVGDIEIARRLLIPIASGHNAGVR